MKIKLGTNQSDEERISFYFFVCEKWIATQQQPPAPHTSSYTENQPISIYTRVYIFEISNESIHALK